MLADRSARRLIDRATRHKAAIGLVTALLSGGSLLFFVAAGGAAGSSLPTNSTPPTISGTAQEGATLTVNNGVWAGDAPISFSYQWLRCDSTGGSCASIIGQTSSSYVLKNVDVGTTLRASVTATNPSGSTSATTVPTAAVVQAPVAPQNTSAPTISGVPEVGRVLIANPGTWTGTSPITYTYRWLSCDKNGGSCSFVGGSTTQQAHTLTSAEVGHSVRVQVTATNAAGNKTVASAQTALVTTSTPANGCAKQGGTIPIAGVMPPARLLIDQTQVSPSTINFGTTVVTARFHVTACGGPVQGVLVYATAVPYNQFSIPNEQTTDASGWATLQFSRLAGFPATQRQQLLVMFVRARKSGENVLGGISTRRLVSFRVTR